MFVAATTQCYPHLSLDENYFGNIIAPYKALYNNCALVDVCDTSASDTRRRIWSVYRTLEQHPIRMTIHNYNTGEPLTAVLNGDRFIASLINGSYSMDIFHDLSLIMEQLEKGESEAIKPYFARYVSYLLDPQWGDISAQAHYCYETKPFINHRELREDINRLPKGFIRDSTKFFYQSYDFCDMMGITNVDLSFGEKKSINVPTLFLHGKHDTITLLSDVENEKNYFLIANY